MSHAGDGVHGHRLRGLIVVLWRAGLRICEALALAETDLDPRRGLLVRRGKGGRRREVGMDDWARGSSSNHGSRSGSSCRSDRCSASSTVRHAHGRGQPAPPAQNCNASPARPGCGGASRRTSCATRTPSKWPAKVCADRHPTPARPHQPRHHLDLRPRHRQHRDHRHRPRPPCADGPRRQLARALTPRPAAGKLATSSPPTIVEVAGHERTGRRATRRMLHSSRNSNPRGVSGCARTARRSTHAASRRATPGGRKGTRRSPPSCCSFAGESAEEPGHRGPTGRMSVPTRPSLPLPTAPVRA
jgi:hypothetical protein